MHVDNEVFLKTSLYSQPKVFRFGQQNYLNTFGKGNQTMANAICQILGFC